MGFYKGFPLDGCFSFLFHSLHVSKYLKNIYTVHLLKYYLVQRVRCLGLILDRFNLFIYFKIQSVGKSFNALLMCESGGKSEKHYFKRRFYCDLRQPTSLTDVGTHIVRPLSNLHSLFLHNGENSFLIFVQLYSQNFENKHFSHNFTIFDFLYFTNLFSNSKKHFRHVFFTSLC